MRIHGKSWLGTVARDAPAVAIPSRTQSAVTTGVQAAALIAVLLALPAALAADASETGKVFRWVDDDGVVHFGDQVPPEYADKDRQILNRYGVTIETRQHVKPEAQLESERRAKAEQAAAAAAVQRDGVLLSTYLSVDEIEALRDRRVGLIANQIEMTEHYLDGLRQKLTELQQEAGKYKPYSTEPDAPAIDENLAGEISDVLDSITAYEDTLAESRVRRDRLTAQFAADIARFRELTAGP